MKFTIRNILEVGVLSYFAYDILKKFSGKQLFRWLVRLPIIRNKIDIEIEKAIEKVRPGLIEDRFKSINLPANLNDLEMRTTLQDESMDDISILERIKTVSTYNVVDYKISGAIYADETELSDLIGKIYSQTAWLNPTHSSVWPELTQLEAETYAMISKLFYLTDENSAILTPGGTMSNIQAIYAYRNMMEIEHGISRPNIVAPITAHTSFKKACQILKIEYRTCRVDDHTGKADVKNMESLIDSNTICLVGSAPSFPYGIIDPISQISELAKLKNIPFHVDCCLGGFMVPFCDLLSEVCDFRDPNITSISADPHKFGQSPKGISLLIFRNNNIKQYLTFVDLTWTGGLYVMPDFFGSRAGSNIAILWAILNKIGRNNYVRITNDLIQMRREICEKINQTFNQNVLRVLGCPELSTFGLKSDLYNIHFINKIMMKYGWEFNSLPDGLHFCLTKKHLLNKDKFMQEFMTDFLKTIEYISDNPDENPGSTSQIYCSTQAIPNFAEDILDKIGRLYITVQGMIIPEDDDDESQNISIDIITSDKSSTSETYDLDLSD